WRSRANRWTRACSGRGVRGKPATRHLFPCECERPANPAAKFGLVDSLCFPRGVRVVVKSVCVLANSIQLRYSRRGQDWIATRLLIANLAPKVAENIAGQEVGWTTPA